MPRYRVNVGMDYPPNKRAEVGDVVSDLPSQSIKWLVADGAIELVSDKAAPAPTVEPEGEGE